MYGKRRIVITKNNEIVIAGTKPSEKGGDWMPIGRFSIYHDCIIGRLRNISSYATRLDESNSSEFKVETVSQIRDLVKEKYSKELF